MPVPVPVPMPVLESEQRRVVYVRVCMCVPGQTRQDNDMCCAVRSRTAEVRIVDNGRLECTHTETRLPPPGGSSSSSSSHRKEISYPP